jgi:hypothetical protein
VSSHEISDLSPQLLVMPWIQSLGQENSIGESVDVLRRTILKSRSIGWRQAKSKITA